VNLRIVVLFDEVFSVIVKTGGTGITYMKSS